jgi:hypothetical protein
MNLKAMKRMFMYLGIGVLSIAIGSGVAPQKPCWNIGGTALAASALRALMGESTRRQVFFST